MNAKQGDKFIVIKLRYDNNTNIFRSKTINMVGTLMDEGIFTYNGEVVYQLYFKDINPNWFYYYEDEIMPLNKYSETLYKK